MKKKPRKPTEPFGHIKFGKDGSVKKLVEELSDNKEFQESEAIQRFLEGLKRVRPELEIQDCEKLSEADHDFLLQTTAKPITIQLTEVVERDYVKKISKAEYDSGIYHEFIQKEYGQIPWVVDTERKNSALVRAIENKVKKNYSKSDNETLWLVIFSTSSLLLTEFWEGGERKVGPPLKAAREYTATLTDFIFDEVWFANLQINPVKVWPL